MADKKNSGKRLVAEFRGQQWNVEGNMRKVGKELDNVSDLMLPAIKQSATVAYFGRLYEYNKETKKSICVKNSNDFKAEFKERYASEAEYEKAYEELIVKSIVMNYEGVYVDELMKLHNTQSTVFKLYYNNFIVNKTLDEITQMPKKIEVKVREILDSRGGGSRTGTKSYSKRKELYHKAAITWAMKVINGEASKEAMVKELGELAELWQIKEEDRKIG